MNRKSIAAAIALSVLSTATLAQTTVPQTPAEQPSAKSEARAKFREACGGDVQKFCANVEKAKGATRACLDANASQLSDACKVARTDRDASRVK